MKVIDFDGVHETASVDELEKFLSKKYENGVKSFWISHGKNDYPKLSLLVKGDLATLHYFPRKGHPGFMTVGTLRNLEPGGIVKFSINHSPADDVSVLNEAVIPFSIAVKAVKEFSASTDLPPSVEWFEL